MRAIKIASLSDEAKQAAVALGLDDNQSALLAAASELVPEKQVEKLKERAQAKASRAPRAKKPPADERNQEYADQKAFEWFEQYLRVYGSSAGAALASRLHDRVCEWVDASAAGAAL